ncbi:acetyl-CoA carboxylase biotin carboxyl carrier protein subunit [Xanthobacteraceae bacterium Astr-EGSB]|uniref:acetyl-CoA carboxylase biotin carboxyl carrier protein subunit n=1 Tax=Astrobacterium formosum TaxID=3069710 RepID=UPI0027B873EE|nr:acetyl-CoA carboxylase biotin carboxyl carrier protein subunit [Xanthobacteraceae bacterium Astr-EGSB]
MAEEVRAPLAGTILDVLVDPGDTVEADEELIIIEAMKMQNLIYAPVAGTVGELRVKPGDKVEPDAVLLTIE